MIGKLVVGTALAALLALVSLAGAAFATDATGVGPAQAMTAVGEWTELPTNATRWYAFQYAGDESQIEVVLEMVPNNDSGKDRHISRGNGDSTHSADSSSACRRRQ